MIGRGERGKRGRGGEQGKGGVGEKGNRGKIGESKREKEIGKKGGWEEGGVERERGGGRDNEVTLNYSNKCPLVEDLRNANPSTVNRCS